MTYKTKGPQKRFPLLIALHGGGGNGRDYLEFWQEEASRHQFMVLAPTYGVGHDLDPKDLFPLLDEVIKQYPVDTKRIFVLGASAGAYVARVLVAENPSLWRGAIFISAPFYEKENGDKKPDQFPSLLFIHGQKDIYKVENIIESVKVLRRQGIKVDLLVDPEAGHGLGSEWNEAVFKWIQRVEKGAS